MLNEPCRELIELSERTAGGFESQSRLTQAKRAVSARAKQEFAESGMDGLAELGRVLLLSLRLKHLPGWEGMPPSIVVSKGTQEQQQQFDPIRARIQSAQLWALREIIGNPFHPVAYDPSWRSPELLSLAEEVYADRSFEGLPNLADTLENLGCQNQHLLNHFRGPGPHVRGCWALDLVLGKG
jgi:hypothetical protein